MRIRKIISGLIAAAAALSLRMPDALPTYADEAHEPYYFYEEEPYLAGDANNNSQIDIADVILLQNWLLGRELPEGTRITRADMLHNGIINPYDLIMLKRVLFGYVQPEWIWKEADPQPEEELMYAPVSTLEPTLLSQGHNKLLMLVVDFPDCKFLRNYTADQIREISFGEGDPGDPDYPLESVAGYYERASYGALTMDVDIYKYTAHENAESYVYTNENGKRYADADKLLDELMSSMDNEIDFSKYDRNSDGVMDTILLSVADTASNDGWWPCSNSYYGNLRFDGVKAGNFVLGNTSPSDVKQYNNTWIHELGHAMGLPDYYKYDNTNGNAFGLNGPAGTEMMDDAYGDMCAYSKLMYGWYKPSQVHIYEGGTQTFKLSSSQVAGNCIVIPRGDLNYYFSEYMVIEYATGEGNNTGSVWGGGIRILHCDSRYTLDDQERPYLLWNNYSPYYDKSNEKQRVLRLVNEKEGGDFFGSGSNVNGSISGFHWYDDQGWQSVETGLNISIGELSDGMFTITISS